MVAFSPFSDIHFVMLGATALLVVLPLVLARWWHTLARGIILLEILWAASGAVLLITERGMARWQDVLPLHLCDLVIGLVAVAFIWRRQLAFELAYFYGLTGSIAALVTPDIAGTMPLWRIAYFFGGHGAVIAAVLYLFLHERLRPQRGAVWRAMAGLAVYVVVVGTFNALADTNYGYLCRKPFQPSVLDYLGPWPWYVGWLGVIGWGCFAVLYYVSRSICRRAMNQNGRVAV